MQLMAEKAQGAPANRFSHLRASACICSSQLGIAYVAFSPIHIASGCC